VHSSLFVRFIVFLHIFVVLTFMGGCATPPIEIVADGHNQLETAEIVPAHQYTFVIDYDFSSDSPNIVFPDGTMVNSFEAYTNKIFEITTNDPNAAIIITIGDDLSEAIGTELTVAYNLEHENDTGIEPPWTYQVSGYTLSGGTNYGYVGGCLKRNGSYYAVRLNSGSSQVFDMHMVAYTSGGRLCVGFYESVRGWCWTDCTPTYSDVVSALVTVAVSVGLSYGTAYIIANIAAPLAVVALAI